MTFSISKTSYSQCATVLNAGGLVEVCDGEGVNIFAEINVAPFFYDFEWLADGVPIPGEGGPGDNSLIGYIPSGTVKVTVRATGIGALSGCPVLEDNVTVSVRDGATVVRCMTIDDFEEPGTASTIEVQNGGPLFATVTTTGSNSGGIIGNVRTNNLWFVSGPFGSRADVLEDTDPFLPSPPNPPMTVNPFFGEWFYSSSNDDGNESNSELLWDANGAGLNWEDLCGCENDPTAAFRLYDYFADQSGVTMTLTLTDNTGKEATIVRNMPGSNFGSYDEEFALLDFTVDAGFNWCEIDAISLYMDTNNISVDFKFRQFDFCKSVGLGLGDGDRKMCLGECIKLDTMFDPPLPWDNIPTDNIEWEDNNGNPLDYDEVVCIDQPGMYNYTVTVEDELGCVSTLTQTFSVCDTPKVDIDDEEICKGESVTLTPTVNDGNTPYTYSWSPSTGLSCTDCLNPVASPNSTTTYTLTVGTSENGDNGGRLIDACYGSGKVTVTVHPLPTVEIDGSDIICDNISTTELCADATGPGISYEWSTGATTQCIDASAGNYSVTVTDINGCKANDSHTVNEVLSPDVDITADPSLVCEGDQSKLTVSVTNGKSPFSYNWSTGQTGSMINVTPSAPSSTYTVTVTDDNNCIGTAEVTVTAAPNTVSVNVTTVDDMCNMGLGSATANPSSGTPPYSYEWNTGATTQTISGLFPGTYTVTVTDAGTCTDVASGQVLNLGAPNVDINGANPICEGESITLTSSVNGGTGPYNYLWSPGGFTSSSILVSPTSTTTYTVQVTDQNGCTDSDQAEVIVNDNPELTITPNNPEYCEGSSIQLSADVSGGTPDFSYSWTPATGLSCTDCPNPVANPASTQTYTLSVEDDNGCTDEATVTVTVNDNPELSLVSKSDEICGKGNGSITVTATGGDGSFSYEWNTIPIQTGPTAVNLSAGSYTVVVTDGNGCKDQLTETINNVGGPSVTLNGATPICDGQSLTLTANATGGTGPYEYLWTPGGATTSSIVVSPSSTTTYTVQVTDANDCVDSDAAEVVVYDNPELTISPNNPEFCEGGNIQLSANVSGGTPDFSYTWTPATGLSCTDCPNPVANPASTQTYTLTVEDDNGCTDQETVTVTVNDNPELSLVSKTDEICGQGNGSITVTATGGDGDYSYAWNTVPVQIGPTAVNLSAGTYTVVVTDGNGCKDELTETIINVGGPSVNISGAKPICEGESVTLTANASGGTGPYEYLWSPGGATTSSITVSPTSTTTYTVQVTDANDCSASANAEVEVYDRPTIVIVPQSEEICVGENVQITTQIIGGTGPFEYSWDPTNDLSCTDCSNPVASPTTTTTYTLTVEDANGCTDSKSIEITVYPNPTVTIDDKVNEDCNMSNGSITAAAAGGSGTYSYAWNTNPVQTTPQATGLSAGTYTVVVTDENGCTATTSASIINENGPTVTVSGSADPEPSCIGDDVTLTANPLPFPGNYSYQWSNGLGTGQTAQVNNVQSTSDYSVTVTDNGTNCSAVATYTLTVVPCAEITHTKRFVSVVQTGLNTYDVTYEIVVENIGTGNGEYTLLDSLAFDPDVQVNGVVFSSDAPGNPGNPGPVVPTLNGDNRYELAIDQTINDVDPHTYTLVVSATLDLDNPPAGGNGEYNPCLEGTPGDYEPENGLYNLSILDTPNDLYDERDEACGELPIIRHTKSGPVVTQTGAREWDVTYTISVVNYGYGPGSYTLVDRPGFDNDVEYNGATYSTNAPGNAGNPGPQGLLGQGPWTLASSQAIAVGPNTEHIYTITIPVSMDLETVGSQGDEVYTSCGEQNGQNDPVSGEGLYNQSELDVNNDGLADEFDEVCGDLPYVVHEKTSVAPTQTGPNAYQVVYTIEVTNLGGAVGEYDLEDAPAFDDDFVITGATYATDAPGNAGNPGPLALAGNGPWNLADDQSIAAGPNVTNTYTITVDVTINLDEGDPTGDNNYIPCGDDNGSNDPEPNEGLYNQSRLDVNNDGQDDEESETCEDVPYIEHEKTIISVTQNADDTYDVVYHVVVSNTGAINADYGLFDEPLFDNDIVINTASYSSTVHANTGLTLPAPSGGWQLANNQNLNAGSSHTYVISMNVEMDLIDPSTPGDGVYDECGKENGQNDPEPYEGLYNVAGLDVDNDGQPDQFDDACGDIPFVTHVKNFVSATYDANSGTYDVVFEIIVDNLGGATGQYDLFDEISFENDFVVNSSLYETTAPGHPANGNPMALAGTNWTLANDQNIVSGGQHVYTLTINVEIDLSDPDSPGDELYFPCGFQNGVDDPEPNEGLYNMSRLDRTNDGQPEEEDEACGDVEIVDLALRKTLVTPEPYSYGDLLEFEIEVHNQGNIVLTEIVVNDYMPDGYSFSSGENVIQWSQVGANLLAYEFINGLQPGFSQTITLNLTLEQSEGAEAWTNYAEIASMKDLSGADRSDDDIDSEPNSDSPYEREVKPGDAFDDVISGRGEDDGEDEDDHDPAGVNIFDLALIKQPAVAGPYTFGQVVPFNITVVNQGNIAATDIEIFDYVPEGLEYVAGQNFPLGWTYTGDPVNIASTTIADVTPLQPSESATIQIFLRVVSTDGKNGDAWTNYAEISDARDEEGDPVNDIDSTPDGNKDNDEGGEPNSPNDDRTDGDGTPGDDEDDHDPAILDIFDLALRKVVNTPAPYVYDQNLVFDIWVFNQGNIIARDIEITDYLPEGYGFVPGDNPTWNGVAPSPTTTISEILPGDSAMVSIQVTLEMTDGGRLKWINYAEITEAFDDQGVDQTDNDIDSNPGSDNADERDVLPGDPADDDILSNDKGGEEDDHDPAEVEIFDLAQIVVIKNEQPFYKYGDDITFELTIVNQGNEPATDIKIVDYVPDGYIYNPGDNPLWSQFPTNTPTTLSGLDLAPGEMTTIEIILELRPTDELGGYVNYTEIISANGGDGLPRTDIDSEPDGDLINDEGGQVETSNDNRLDGNGSVGDDEDDHDPARPRVYDLAQIKKVTTPEPFIYGQSILFEFTVVNQGNVPATNIVVTDSIPEGFSFTPGGVNAGWSDTYPEIQYTITDVLFEKDTQRIQVELTLEKTAGGIDKYTNLSEISSAQDTLGNDATDADSDPDSELTNDEGGQPDTPNDDRFDGDGTVGDDEDDQDPARINVYDLALRKTTSQVGPYSYGDVVTIDLWVYNQGNQIATEVELTEYIPVGFEYLASNNGSWSYNSLDRKATLTSLISSITPGDSALVQIDLRLIQSYEVGAWDNYAEISDSKDENGDPIDDIDSTPDDEDDNDDGGEPNGPTDDEIDEESPIDEDDHDPFRPDVVDMALNKKVPGKAPYYVPGDIVPFVITIFNQGNVEVANTVIYDYMPPGFIFNPLLPANAGWTNNAGQLEYTYGPVIGSQDSAKIEIHLEVTIPANPTLDDWRNYAEIAVIRDTEQNDRSGDEADSYPASDAPHERAVRDNDDGDPNDDNIFGDYKNEGEDEDDHDPEEIEVTGALGDYVWFDEDADGVQDPGEEGVEGVIVRLYTCDGTFVRQDTTDENGFYFFDFLLPLQEYYVIFDLAPLNNPDYVFTFQNQGGDDELDSDANAAGVGHCTFIDAGERDSTYDAGIVLLSGLGDFVWHDRNANGVQDPGEEGISEVVVKLYTEDGILVQQTETDANGYYFFDDLMPQTYYVEFEYMNMWIRTIANASDNDAVDSDVDDSNGPNTTALIDLPTGIDDITWDLGLYKCIPVGDFVWFDLDADGVQDAPENGINGVRIYIYDEFDNLIDQTVSGPDPHTASGDGYYKFCVEPGTYYIVFERPGHLAASRNGVGFDPEKDSDITHFITMYSSDYFTVISGDMKCDIDGGFHSKATMGDNVWYDENQNGLQDAGEQGVSGVVISAYDKNDMMFWQDVSNQDGEFYMDGLSSGEYYLKFDPPSGYTFTYPDAGDNDGLDSDVDDSNGPRTTALYSVTPGEHEPDVDGGLVTGFLPAELVDFEAKLNGKKVDVTWRTAVEINNERFDVERRHESELSFIKIGERQAAGTIYTSQDYGFEDFDIRKSGVYYYRLRQVDTDGKEVLSEVRTVEVERSHTAMTVFPNPTSDVLNLELSILEATEIKVELQDKWGRGLTEYSQEIELGAGQSVEQIEVEKLPSGNYTLVVTIDGVTENFRFTKI